MKSWTFPAALWVGALIATGVAQPAVAAPQAVTNTAGLSRIICSTNDYPGGTPQRLALQ